ncbi:MAG: hypothetical protein QXP70_04490 [Methanomassiliicoccales archaeon]
MPDGKMTQQIGIFTSEDIPPWLPSHAKESRNQVFWAQIASFVEVPVAIFLAILMFYYYFRYSARSYLLLNPGAKGLATDFFSFGIYFIVIVIVCTVEVAFIKAHISNAIDSGKFLLAQERSMLWGILGILFGLVPGILLISASVSLRELNKQPTASADSSMPKTEQTKAQSPPIQSVNQPPRAETPTNAQQEQKQSVYVIPPANTKMHTDMIKCKKCGASYPSFMHACPSCNEPKS